MSRLPSVPPDTGWDRLSAADRDGVAGQLARPSRRRTNCRGRSDDPAPAPLTGLPAGDGLVLADHLDLPQMQAGVAHGLLCPGHPADAGHLWDLVLGTGLLDEDETGRAASTWSYRSARSPPLTPGTSPRFPLPRACPERMTGWPELSRRWLPGRDGLRRWFVDRRGYWCVPYDPSIYLGSAAHYRYGRPAYSPELEAVLAQETGLDGTGRLLDVGCGPGVLTVRLAHLFAHAVGLDPDAGMLAEGCRAADERGS